MAAAISQDDYLNDTSQFDLARKKAQDQYSVNLQARKDALARRFAALGNLDAGARIKLEGNAANEEAANLTNANEGIQAQQQAEIGRRKEVVQGQQFQAGEAEKGRTFATSERLGGQAFSGQQAAMQRAFLTGERQSSQDFTAQQGELQRKFASGERLSSQDFQALQASLGRDFTSSEREALQKYQSGEREAGQTFAAGEAQKTRDAQAEQFMKTYGLSKEQFDAAQDQFRQAFVEEQRVNNANMSFAQQALDKKGFLENLTGMGGGGIFSNLNSSSGFSGGLGGSPIAGVINNATDFAKSRWF